ncbi:MAG: hypothetical protein V4719_25695 [Planctomycetota bacterium]
MPSKFDPDYQWLGILRQDQSPHSYRLLGLEPFEADPQVIAAAADRQLGFLRQPHSGATAHDCQKLLNEVSHARLRLLKPAAKQTSDFELRGKLKGAGHKLRSGPFIGSTDRMRKSPFRNPLALFVAGLVLLLAAPKPTQSSDTVAQAAPPATEPSLKNDPPKTSAAPVPDLAAQETSNKELHELFKDEYGNLKRDEAKLLFATKLKSVADESDDDLTTKYVCLEEARRLTAEAGDLTKAMTLADTQALKFQTNAGQVKAATLKIVSQKFKSPAVNADLISHSLTLIDELMLVNDYQLAGNVAMVAGQVAVRMKDKATAAMLVDLRRENEELAKEFPLANQAHTTLQKQPNNAEAKALWGRWLCFREDKWDEGLKLLQDTGDEKQRELVARDLTGPTETEAMIQLGSDWLDYAKSRKDRSLVGFCTRAVHWLSQAEKGATGLTKTRIDKLIEQAYFARDKTTPLMTLIDSVSKKVKQKLYVSSVETRHDIGSAYEELPPEGGVLVGFNYSVGKYLNYYTVVKAIQPIYATKGGLKRGEWRGKPEGPIVEIMAREGYAVSNVGHWVGACVATMQVVFSRVTRSGLDLDNSYVSKNIGDEKHDIPGYVRGEKPDKQPIIGMFGHANDFWGGFGVITTK